MEDYTTEEVVECYVDYIKDGKRIGLSIPLHEGRLRGRVRWVRKVLLIEITIQQVRHISIYYSNSRLLHHISRNTYWSFTEIT
jgi:hypothetical protein